MIKSGVLHSDLLDDTAEHLKKLLSFLQSPSNAMLYAYQEGLIEEMSHKIISWKDDLCIQLYESLLADKNSLPIETTIATIKSYRFVRHVDIRGFNSVYS
jgi:hypothetical protein